MSLERHFPCPNISSLETRRGIVNVGIGPDDEGVTLYQF